MPQLEDVYANYPATLATGTRVSTANTTPDEIAIREGLPAFLADLLEATGRDRDAYKIYGGIGQLNWNRALVPWVAICNRAVTTTTNNGYYIVLLFRQEMDGCYPSLNQGYTQFKRAFELSSIALRQITRSAHACAEYLDPPADFITGPIDLGATHGMGKGYERGAIVSAHYARGVDEGDVRFAQDLASLLQFYDRLQARVGRDILTFSPPAAENDFQAAALEVARRGDAEPPLPGPLPPPPPLTGGRTGRHKRDPKMAAIALRNANFSCEVDAGHASFVARKTGRTFVEAHHLIPVSRQQDFNARLDVPENIVALCPNCHRLLHHGVSGAKRQTLTALQKARDAGLGGRGITVTSQQLLSYYGDDLTDDD
jgi:5-methylcytosine-specific restriction protein A